MSVLSMWLSIDSATSRGSRPTQMYVTSVVVGHPVERRVGLDEPAVRLGVQVGEHVVRVAGQHVEPRREHVERQRKLVGLEHEQRADHLRPRRAALGGRADDDVAGPELEAVPAVAVGDQTAVARPFGHGAHAREGQISEARPADLGRCALVSGLSR